MTTKEITLTPGATAEPNTCGSCKFFARTPMNDGGEWYRMNGDCKFKLPPLMEKYAPFVYPRDEEYTHGPRYLKDTDRCDLYQPDGKTYIVQRRVGP